jgi:hypothetical protein
MLALRAARPGTADIQNELIGNRKAVEVGKQMAAVGQCTIGLRAYQQLNFRRPAGKCRIKIALTIADDGDRYCAGFAKERRGLR